MNRENMPVSDIQQKNTPFWQRIWDWSTAPSTQLKDIGEQRSARLAASFLLAIAVLNFVGGLARAPRMGLVVSFSGPIGYSFVALVITYILSRTKWYRAAIFLFSLSFSSLAYISILQEGNTADFGTFILIYVPLSLIVASSFVSAPAVFLLTGLNIAAYMFIQNLGISLPENIGAQAGIITVIGVVLMLLTNFRNNTEKIRLVELQEANSELEKLGDELEQRVKTRTQELVSANQEVTRRSEQLTAIAELTRSITNIQDLDSLLPTITQFISKRLGYYHVGIFINDANNINAVLRAANSVGGQRMLNRDHKLKIGIEGIVGYAIKSGQPRIALDVGADSVHFINPDLPESQSEMALPLRLGSEIIGALDIQSTETNAFSDDDMPVFNTLADQVAVAIQNARLLEQAQTALSEAEEAYAEQTGRAWRSFSEKQSVSGYRFDGIEPQPITKTYKSKGDGQAGLILPMRLRGQTIGKLKLKTGNANRKLTDEEVTLVEAAIERAALALESARLLEEAQRLATKEHTISESTARVSAAFDIESVLKATAEELERTLGGSEVIIQLENEE